MGANLESEVDGQRFVRCAQAAPPSARKVRAGTLILSIDQRVLTVEGAASLRIAAFTGPVGAAFEASDLALLAQAKPGLIFYLGGLGDDEVIARQNLASLATLHVPVVFVAGGADHYPVIEAAFAGLGEGERESLIQGSGLREVRFGADRFVIAAGAPLGRYALGTDSCGLDGRDFEQIASDTKSGTAQRSWLLSWHAATGRGFGGSDLGSPELLALKNALSASGALFAYPEVVPPDAASQLWLVPRLSRMGSQRADGSRVPAAVLTLVMTDQGPVRAP